MIQLAGKSLLLGGFHDHWSRAGGRNSALLLASLDYYHYDFLTLMDGNESDEVHRKVAGHINSRIRIYPGREEMFGWGHVVTVNPSAPRMGTDNGDYESTLRQLKKTCDLVILAHPEYPGTWEKLFLTGEMDRLLDEGLLDGINLINTNGFEVPQLRQLIQWFNKRSERGLITPIVNGWDAHLILPRRDLPTVLYSRETPPKGHIDTAGNSRTILFCEENSLEAIVSAVKRGMTVIEDLATGELVGPNVLVRFLQQHDYAGVVKKMDECRDGIQLTVAAPWVANETASFTLSHEGDVKVALPTPAGLVDVPVQFESTTGRSTIEWIEPPDGKNTDFAAIALRTKEGIERIWAVVTEHPIQLEVLPKYRNGMAGIECRALRPFSGTVWIEIPGLLKWRGDIKESEWLPVNDVGVDNYIFQGKWRAESPEGLSREERFKITFITACKYAGSWSSVPVYSVDNPKFIPAFSYGVGRKYPGPEVFSVYLQFAWDAKFVRMRAQVRDAIHHQPLRGHYVYNADCLQLAFDPVLRRASSIGYHYSYNLALTPEGPELYRWLGPSEERSDGFVAPDGDVSLGDRYLKIEQDEEGLMYELALPWTELAPASGGEDHRMGIYLIAMNNDGEGLIDAMHWPLPSEGMWVIPARWGVINFV